ncbi:MAG: pentapeptide repeat-containing protein [Gammaproteobacteria bacterium]|nr:pentapeptide repeat-containing protein [Gammaproteobacteria bacterium]
MSQGSGVIEAFMATDSGQAWYCQHGSGELLGPFSPAQLVHYAILGALGNSDRFSVDRKQWLSRDAIPWLQPHQFTEENSLFAQDERAYIVHTAAWMDAESERLFSQTAGHLNLLHPVMTLPQRLLYFAFPLLFSLLLALLWWLSPDKDVRDVANCQAPAVAGVNWRNCLMGPQELPGADLRGANLHSVLMPASNLRQVELESADLAYSNISYSDLRDANLREANLKGADLRQSRLQGADLRDADLSFADLRDSDLREAKLSDANLSHALLGGAQWREGVYCLPDSVGDCLLSSAVPMQ